MGLKLTSSYWTALVFVTEVRASIVGLGATIV